MIGLERSFPTQAWTHLAGTLWQQNGQEIIFGRFFEQEMSKFLLANDISPKKSQFSRTDFIVNKKGVFATTTKNARGKNPDFPPKLVWWLPWTPGPPSEFIPRGKPPTLLRGGKLKRSSCNCNPIFSIAFEQVFGCIHSQQRVFIQYFLKENKFL